MQTWKLCRQVPVALDCLQKRIIGPPPLAQEKSVHTRQYRQVTVGLDGGIEDI